MKVLLKIPQSGIAALPVVLMTVGIAAAGLVTWQVLASSGGASALTWVGLAGIVASLLAAGVVSMQGAANQTAANNEPAPEHIAAPEPEPAPAAAEPVPVAAAPEPAGPDPALTAALNAAQQQLGAAETEREAVAGELSAAQDRIAALIAVVKATTDALARAREIVGQDSAGVTPAAATDGAVSGVIANNSREVLDGIDGALATMQQQAAASAQRLQRVSESATETVQLLNELIGYTDQTEILSVNAAIQATLAGDAGNGFAVIAEQLQRVAGRSGVVCNRVETLSNLVSNDVGKAVSDNRERNAELARSKRLSGDLRTALNELTKPVTAAAAPVTPLPPELLALLDDAGEKLNAALSAADEGGR